MTKDFLDRFVELVKEDEQLHTALLVLLRAKAAHEKALANLATLKALKK